MNGRQLLLEAHRRAADLGRAPHCVPSFALAVERLIMGRGTKVFGNQYVSQSNTSALR